MADIQNFDVENKEDSVAKLAQAEGKPTKWFLFASEFNKIKTKFNEIIAKLNATSNLQGVTNGEANNVTTNPIILKKSEDEFVIIDSTTGNVKYCNKLLNPDGDGEIARYQLNGNFYILNTNNLTSFQYEDGNLYLKDNNNYSWIFSNGEMVISSPDDTLVSRYGYSQFQISSFDNDTFRHEIVTGNSTGLEVSKRPATLILGAIESIKTKYNSLVRTYWNYEFETNVINEFFLPDMADGWNGKLATEDHVTNAVNQLLNGAPSDANTLKELNDKIVAINAIIGGSTADGDSLVNTVAELLAVFSTYPEGTDIATILAGKLNKTDVIESLTQVVSGKALDATQGKILKDLILTKQDIITDAILHQIIMGLNSKSTLADNDGFAIYDTGAGATTAKRVAVSSLKPYLKNYFDTIYGAKRSFISLNSDFTLDNTSTALQDLFGKTANVIAGRKYRFICELTILDASATNATFSLGSIGTANLSKFKFESISKKNGSIANPAGPQMTAINAVGATSSINTATTSSTISTLVSGTFISTTSGTFKMAGAFSATGGTPKTENTSYFELYDIGASTDETFGLIS